MNSRMARVNALVAEVVGEALGREFGEPGVIATVTAVDTTSDLSEAVVKIGTVPDDETTWDKVAVTLPDLQGYLAGKVEFKRTPRLRLEHDHSGADASRIDQLLRDNRA